MTPPATGQLPQAGDEVVIYNQNAEAVLAEQNDNTDSPAINKAAATIANGKAVCSNGAVVFTVERSGEYYRFRNDTYGYLCANGTGNNAFYSPTASEDYEMESRTAKYNGKYSQWLEYYSDSFKVYSMYSSTGDLDYTIYSFSFYPVAEGTELTGGIVNMPAVVIDHLYDAYVGQAYTFSFTVDAPFGVKGDMTATLAGEALTVTEEEGVYTVTIPVEKVTGDKLTVTISGVDNQGKAITRTVEIPVKDEPVFSEPKPMRGVQTGSDKRPAISVALSNAGTEPTITMTVNGKTVDAVYADGRVTYTPAADLTDGRAYRRQGGQLQLVLHRGQDPVSAVLRSAPQPHPVFRRLRYADLCAGLHQEHPRQRQRAVRSLHRPLQLLRLQDQCQRGGRSV